MGLTASWQSRRVGAGQTNFARATAYSEEALCLYAGRQLDLTESINLGAIARDAGDLGNAVQRWLEDLALAGERGDLAQIADALSDIAGIATTWGDARSALLLFGAASRREAVARARALGLI